MAAELWTIAALARFVGAGAQAAGFPRLANAGKSTVWRILDEYQIKPHKISHHLEKRDPEFDRKMQEVLMVYRDVSIYRADAVHDGRLSAIYTVGVDEKPGVQAIGLTAPDLPTVPGKAPTIARDYEYVRRGTVSRTATAAWSSSRCSNDWTSTTRATPSSALCWTTIRSTSPLKKRVVIL